MRPAWPRDRRETSGLTLVRVDALDHPHAVAVDRDIEDSLVDRSRFLPFDRERAGAVAVDDRVAGALHRVEHAVGEEHAEEVLLATVVPVDNPLVEECGHLSSRTKVGCRARRCGWRRREEHARGRVHLGPRSRSQDPGPIASSPRTAIRDRPPVKLTCRTSAPIEHPITTAHTAAVRRIPSANVAGSVGNWHHLGCGRRGWLTARWFDPDPPPEERDDARLS